MNGKTSILERIKHGKLHVTVGGKKFAIPLEDDEEEKRRWEEADSATGERMMDLARERDDWDARR